MSGRRITILLAALILSLLTCSSFGFNGNKKQAAQAAEIDAFSKPTLHVTLNGQSVEYTFTQTYTAKTNTVSVVVAATSQSVTPTAPPIPPKTAKDNPVPLIFCAVLLVAGLVIIFLMHKGVFGKKLETMESNLGLKIETEIGQLETRLENKFVKKPVA